VQAMRGVEMHRARDDDRSRGVGRGGRSHDSHG
jgi:hypothetical protein